MMMIPLWYGLLMGIATAYLGFWYGRSRNWKLMMQEEGEVNVNTEQAKGTGRGETAPRKLHPGARYLASPTGGTVEPLAEEEGFGVRIQTTDSKLYSPSSGRVISVAPRGNAFLILTDWGGEVEVRACNSEDDLLDRFFRPRVIRGEIIRRGKLLLEYDRERISNECEDTAVYLLPKRESEQEVEMADVSQVKAGEALFWVR